MPASRPNRWNQGSQDAFGSRGDYEAELFDLLCPGSLCRQLAVQAQANKILTTSLLHDTFTAAQAA